VIVLSGCHRWAAAPPAQPGYAQDRPVIHSPKDKERIGDEGDSLCVEREQPCYKIRAEGWVPARRTPFFAVEPTLASPRMWIQPPIRGVKTDGSFNGLIYLGESQNGARQYFRVYLFACAGEDRVKEGEEILNLPKDCQVSDPVEIYRER
jgi:hypothetical protein